MSSGTPPTPTSLVRGATDKTHVYVLQGPLRRLVPDNATVVILAAGQPIKVMADADLAKIPLGPPMPSRANGALLQAKPSPLLPPPPVYFMLNAQRRRVPDPETAAFLTTGAVVVQRVDAADLNVIPEGSPLPSRRNGTVYRGGSVFAFLMQNGKKSAVPDATTLRDAGHAVSEMRPLAAADAAQIPDGPALPTTSRFLHPPSSAAPLVLLPVRIETRFQPGELWVRVYPDEVAINSFEPELTMDETAARANYQAQVGTAAAKATFKLLVQQYGPERATWIASAKSEPGTKATSWTQAPVTEVMPERWIVIGYQGNEPGKVLAVGAPIKDSLPVGPAPDGPGAATDDGMKWLLDFDSAVASGMGLKIPLVGAQTRGFNRLVVLGLRSGIAPADAAARFGALLEAHHYTDGLELLPQGTPTNNTEDVQSGLTTRDPDYTALFAVEQGPPLCPTRPTADGDRLAGALGIAPELLAHVKGANGNQDEQARAMNAVMWPATWGYYLDQIVTGAVPSPDTVLPSARSHFIEHVRGRGHYPILRVGRQPYGVLPVAWTANWQPLEARPVDAPLTSLLQQIRPTWENSTVNVPRIPGADDTEAALVSILGMSPASTSYTARDLLGPEYNLAFWKFAQQDIGTQWWTTLTARTTTGIGNLATSIVNTRLANATFVQEPKPLSDVLVAAPPLEGQAVPYVGQFRGLGWQALKNLATPDLPVPMLYLLLRHAALRQYLDTAAELLINDNAAQPDERLEQELVGFSAQARPTPWALLLRNYQDKGPVGLFLDGAKKNTSLPAFAEFWDSLSTLASYDAATLDAAAREALDLAAYRLDAWITSLAQFRLDETRRAVPKGGIVLGGYGWLENVRPLPQQLQSQGYVHAPSLAHATTAAVLRSAYLTHADGAQQPFQIDLSSDRVRLGLHLMDGMRDGQPLGTLLGYRLERSLHESALDAFIDVLRRVSHQDGSGSPDDVIDGLALLRQFHIDPEFWAAPGMPADQATRARLVAVFVRLDDALDSVADLTLSESVHQLLRGNTIRAAATLDAVARGDTPPPEFDVMRTPRAGTALTHRLLAIAPGNQAPGWANTPRAQAEPRLNAWAAAMLANPARVHARAEFVNAAGTKVGAVEIPLNQLGLAPLDLMALPEGNGLDGELGDRLRRAAAAARPATTPADAAVQLVADRDPAWGPEIIGMTEFLSLLQAVARLAGGSRALEPRDLAAPGDPVGSIDLGELKARADAAEKKLGAAQTALHGTGARDAALLGAAAFGVTGAVPALDSTLWPEQVAKASDEVARRIAALTQLAQNFDRVHATGDAQRDHDVERLHIVFGNSFLVLPTLAADLTSVWTQLWANSAALQAGDTVAAQRWLSRAARVRAGASRLDSALLFAEALAGKTLAHFDVAQLPFTAGDRWLGLDLAGTAATSRLSLVAFSPAPRTAGAPLAGLLIDDWVEVLPAPQQITGISFHHDDPNSRAPQTILLGVRHDDFPEWTLEAVEGCVLEALGLAKIRAVDPDALGGLGHYLPALYFAYNLGSPDPDTVSTDFRLALRTTQARND